MLSEQDIRARKSELLNYIEYSNREVSDLLKRIEEEKHRAEMCREKLKIINEILED